MIAKMTENILPKKGEIYRLKKDFDKNYGSIHCSKCGQTIKPNIIMVGNIFKIIKFMELSYDATGHYWGVEITFNINEDWTLSPDFLSDDNFYNFSERVIPKEIVE